MAEGNGLENRRRATVREFESHLLRHSYQLYSLCNPKYPWLSNHETYSQVCKLFPIVTLTAFYLPSFYPHL